MLDNLSAVSAFGFWYQLGFLVFLLWLILGWQRYKERGDTFEAVFYFLNPTVLRITAIIVAAFIAIKGLFWLLGNLL